MDSFRLPVSAAMNSPRIASGRISFTTFAFLLTLSLGRVHLALSATNLLLNPNLDAGTSMPDHWRPSLRGQCESFQWFHSKGAPGELRIEAATGDRAAWTQRVNLYPGWYYLSAELKTEDAGGFGGAFIAMGQFASSAA